MLGKVLRVDVDKSHADAYPSDANKNFAIPATNPIPLWNANHPATQQLSGTHLTYTGGNPTSADYGTPLGEIYATGTRNTFRMSIDRQTGDLWMGDVGENTREEVNFLKAGTYNGTQPPVDFGYASREGTTATNSGLAVANSAGSTSLQWNLSGGGSVIVNSTNPIREGDHSADQHERSSARGPQFVHRRLYLSRADHRAARQIFLCRFCEQQYFHAGWHRSEHAVVVV